MRQTHRDPADHEPKYIRDALLDIRKGLSLYRFCDSCQPRALPRPPLLPSMMTMNNRPAMAQDIALRVEDAAAVLNTLGREIGPEQMFSTECAPFARSTREHFTDRIVKSRFGSCFRSQLAVPSSFTAFVEPSRTPPYAVYLSLKSGERPTNGALRPFSYTSRHTVMAGYSLLGNARRGWPIECLVLSMTAAPSRGNKAQQRRLRLSRALIHLTKFTRLQAMPSFTH
jgi:hypothetical protein